MKKGFKHLVQCHCVLPQFRKRKEPLFHKFVVFSIVDEFDQVSNKLAQCNNCGAIHNVYDICKSEIIVGMDESRTIKTVADIITQLPQDLSSIMSDNDCDMATWEQALFFYENNVHDEPIILSKEKAGNITSIKTVMITEGNRLKVENHIRKEDIEGEYVIS